MKILKIIYACAALTGMALMPLLAEKKPPQISLKELTDPNSSSYVPYPYPKTDFEIIENFKHGVKIHHEPSQSGGRTLVKGAEYRQGILLGLLEDPPVLKVVDILRVEDLVVTSPAIYYFLLLISDHEGRIAALGALGDTGLYFGSGVVTEKTKVPLPFQTEKSVEMIVSRAAGPIRMEKMERIAVYSSISSYPFVPLNRISTSKGVFIVDFLDRVYSIEKEEYWNRHTMKIPDPRLGHITIQDGMNDRIFYLKRIDSGR